MTSWGQDVQHRPMKRLGFKPRQPRKLAALFRGFRSRRSCPSAICQQRPPEGFAYRLGMNPIYGRHMRARHYILERMCCMVRPTSQLRHAKSADAMPSMIVS
jgi:hypothetical protein